MKKQLFLLIIGFLVLMAIGTIAATIADELIGNQGTIDSNTVDYLVISNGSVDILIIERPDANGIVHIVWPNPDKVTIDAGAKWFFDTCLKQMCDDYIKANCGVSK